MGGKDGGTEMYCPRCEAWMVCAAIAPVQVKAGWATRLRSQQVVYSAPFPEVKFFRRGRQCLTCGNEWLTAEVDEETLAALLHTVVQLARLTRTVSASRGAFEEASRALEGLSQALGEVRVPPALEAREP